jgi:hypothetical protein
VWSTCYSILKACPKPKHAAKWFAEPVSPVQDGAPDYLEGIKRVMDLGKIANNLKAGKYCSPLAFREDVQLVFDNCKRYNGNPRLAVRKASEHISGTSENEEWRTKGVMVKWVEASEEGPNARHQVRSPHHSSVYTLPTFTDLQYPASYSP